MEVHHPHHPSHKKKWSEYLLEFFMLFLAVFLGFMAENLRERNTAKEKEHNLIEGVVQNLQDDTTRIQSTLKRQDLFLQKMDSALAIPFQSLRNLATQDTFFHHFFLFYGWNVNFQQNDNTIIQLRNAGGYSLLRKKGVADSIIYLSRLYERAARNGNTYVSVSNNASNIANTIMNLPSYPSDQEDSIYRIIPQRVQFLYRYDTSSLIQLYNWIRVEKATLQVYNKNLIEYRQQAQSLIRFLKKEYGLENG